MERKKIAIIRIRGSNKIKFGIEDTMKMLRLYNKNSCVVVENIDAIVGMINKIKDYITWGEINEEAFRVLIEKRGRIVGNKPLTEEYLKSKTKLDYDSFTREFFDFKKQLKDIPGMKLFFRLKPPTGGFERNGIKTPFSMGGTLGYRKDKINDLVKRMV